MNSNKLNAVEDAAEMLLSLSKNEITSIEIENKVKMVSKIEGISDLKEIEIIVKKLEERFEISMDIGTLFTSENHIRWLNNRRGDIKLFYWDRYQRLLQQNKFPKKVIGTLNKDTDRILEQMEDPFKEGSWSRKGLVVGHVQSGKTANYTGLICKAADSGYKVIIVLAGLSNDLRNQTQKRIDEGFIGRDTGKYGGDYEYHQLLIGVGLIDNAKNPDSMTTRKRDFDRHHAQTQMNLENSTEPVVMVIKKNVSSFEYVISWLKSNNANLGELPMMLIDDEADHASINTKKPDLDPTTINKKIIELLSLFQKNNYVGYTATPFANIFIDPVKGQIFPENFIYSLDTPSNYIGPTKIFSEKDLNIVRILDEKLSEDFMLHIPLGHKKDLEVESLPSSLKESVIVFILSRAARLLRKHVDKHNSMMINISVFQDVQNQISILVREFLDGVRGAVINNYLSTKPLDNSVIKLINEIWNKEFSCVLRNRSDPESGYYSWDDFLPILKDAVAPIEVIEVNSSESGESLNYEDSLYPKGRNVIAVGGFGLSRGLTLEGLLVSYFLRNSRMYDTLMQMGRWFGYRNDFDDLCRIYMTKKSCNWYKHIAEATEELRDDFKKMEKAGLTPKEFGLSVRSHPKALLVTAKNKMLSSKKVTAKVSLSGKQIETSILVNNKNKILENIKTMDRLILDSDRFSRFKPEKSNYLSIGVDKDIIRSFIENFINHPASYMTDSKSVLSYIDILSKNNLNTWDVLLVNNSHENESPIMHKFDLYSVNAVRRTVASDVTKSLTSKKRRFAASSWEASGLSQSDKDLARSKYKGKSTPGNAYRQYRKNPLLMVFLVDARDNEKSQVSVVESGAPGWSISFPWLDKSIDESDHVEYMVNTKYWNEQYGDILEDETYDE